MVNNNFHKKTQGRCLCGQVQFEIHGELRDIVNCHCSKCRKFHGNYGAYTSVKVENLKITEQKSLKRIFIKLRIIFLNLRRDGAPKIGLKTQGYNIDRALD
jgi:hypothetical protein